jgi:hypothetical protein
VEPTFRIFTEENEGNEDPFPTSITPFVLLVTFGSKSDPEFSADFADGRGYRSKEYGFIRDHP